MKLLIVFVILVINFILYLRICVKERIDSIEDMRKLSIFFKKFESFLIERKEI